jgi:dimethylaniline monooxygenase (N-oxide forming)
MDKFGLKPEHNFMQGHPTINGEVLDRIGAGKILVRPNISKFTSSNTVEFEDGTIEEIDTVIYCTGYKIEHPFLDSASILGQTPISSSNSPPASPSTSAASNSSSSDKIVNRIKLYKNIFPVNHKNIAFVGLVQPNGSVMPVSEMQSRWVARLFAGNLPPLPGPQELNAAVEKAVKESPLLQKDRYTVQVDYVQYMDELADAMGCKPDLWKLWRNNWLLATYVTFGPAVPAQYRLEGPGKWEGAEAAVADACKGYDFRKVVSIYASLFASCPYINI